MFSWSCPKCGREVPPSYSDCPLCNPAAALPPQTPAAPARPQAPAAPSTPAGFGGIPTSTIQMTGIPMSTPAQPRPAAPAPQPVAPAYAPPPVAPQAQPAAPSLPPPPPMQWQQPEEKKIPNWLGFLIAAAVFGGIAYSVIWYTSRDEKGTAKKASAETLAPKSTSKHPYANGLEVAGFRITNPGKNKVNVQFLVINHANYEMNNLGGTITLRTKGLGPEAPPAAVFKFKVSSVPPFGAKEVEVNEVMEILKPNDMPDWQFYVPEVDITSPVE